MLKPFNYYADASLRYIKYILFVIFFNFLQYGLLTVTGISWVVLIDDAIILYMAAIILLPGNQNIRFVKTFLDKPLIALAIMFTASALLNITPLMNCIFAFKNYFLIFFLFYFIIYSKLIDQKGVERIIRFVFALFSIELIIQITQIISRTVFNISFLSSSKSGLFDDIAIGTFSGSNDLSYCYFFVLFYVAYLFIVEKRREYLRYMIIFCVGLVVSFGLYSILMFPILFVLYNLKHFFHHTGDLKRYIIIAGVFIAIFGILVSMNLLSNKMVDQRDMFYLFKPSFITKKILVDEYNVWSGSARLLWYPVTQARLQEYAYHPLVGMGPGMYASYAAFRLMPHTNESIYNLFGQIEIGLDPYVDSQIIPIWGELGYIGLFLFLMLFIMSAVHFYRIFTRAESLQLKALAVTASAASVYMLLGTYVNHFIENQNIMINFILFIAFAEKVYLIERKK
ncbi:hypothetical protein ACFL4D_02140 [Candidatus Margulisiibacteriota bacterium]